MSHTSYRPTETERRVFLWFFKMTKYLSCFSHLISILWMRKQRVTNLPKITQPINKELRGRPRSSDARVYITHYAILIPPPLVEVSLEQKYLFLTPKQYF